MSNKPNDQVSTVTAWKIVLATALCMLLLMVLAVVLINSITGRNWPFDLIPEATEAATEPSGTTAPTEVVLGGPEELGMSIDGIVDVDSYTLDADQITATADEVIVQIGDYTIDNRMLQIFYYMEMSSFVADRLENGYDLASYGLDINKPLDQQTITGYTVTWEQFFLHNALVNWWRYIAVNRLANEAGFQISDADRASLDAVPADLEEEAVAAGFESADALLKDRMGPACDLETYLAYMELTARGDLYYNEFLKGYEPSAEEVKGFFEENADYYAYYYGVTMDSGKMVSVRHVLLVPEGATTDDSTGYVVATDEQWAAGLTAAQAMLDGWVASGAKEEDFAALANEHSTDGGSNTNGGLYEGVLQGQMVTNFDAWLFEEGRETGDYGVVKTEFGYHLMYFVGASENEAWYDCAYAHTKEYGYGFTLMVEELMNGDEFVPALDKVVLPDISRPETAEETE